MAVAQPVPHLDVAEYLEQERNADVRHEYINGEIFSMVGASTPHNLITANLLAAFHGHLRGTPCRVFMNDMKVRIETANTFYYPDILVVCENLKTATDSYYQTDARLIVAVLSSSTETRDRMEKRLYYQTLPDLQEYVLVAQNRIQVEIYRRSGDYWDLLQYGANEDVQFASIDFVLPLSEIYENVSPATDQPTS
jgi:Uma2 family endonuclease